MQNKQSSEIKSGTQDEIEGTAKSLAGKVKESIGNAVGNPRLKAQGASDQFEGKTQKKIGEIKKVFGN